MTELLPDAAAVEVADCGDSGLLVTVTGGSSVEQWITARTLADSLRQANPAGLIDVVASYASVFIAFDPLAITHADLRALLAEQPVAVTGPTTGREFLVPVVYGGAFGEDLDEVAEELALAADGVIGLHTSGPWTVRLLGPPVGMPMMDGQRMPQSVRRRKEPRTRVPAGSVAISGQQSVIYPAESPGGWRLIGRTPVQLFDLARDPVTAYRPGDDLRFLPIAADSWTRWQGPLADLQPALTSELSGAR